MTRNFPSSPATGDIYTYNNTLYTFDGDKWVGYTYAASPQPAEGDTPSGPVDPASSAPPADSLLKTGDTMTGNLEFTDGSSTTTTLSTDGSAVFVGKVTSAETLTADTDGTLTTKKYVDDSVAAAGGGGGGGGGGSSDIFSDSNNNLGIGNDVFSTSPSTYINLAVGNGALRNISTGMQNIALGHYASQNLTGGFANIAIGHWSLNTNTVSDSNIAIGSNAMRSFAGADLSGRHVAIGYHALRALESGYGNTAIGMGAMEYCTTGQMNCAMGYGALSSVTTGSGNICIGPRTAPTPNSSVGDDSPVFNVTTEDNRIVMGHTAITNAYVQVAWEVTSDARDKMNFAEVPYGLDFINELEPITYQFKVDRDTETPHGPQRFGFKAQDILALEGSNPIIIDTEDPENLKYNGEHLVPVLVNAVKELTARLEAAGL